MTEPALLRMALGLVFVIILILACAWLARRTGVWQRPPQRLLRQVDHLALGPRASVAVVAVDNTWLVLGVTPAQITLLHTLPAGTLPTADETFPTLLSRFKNARRAS